MPPREKRGIQVESYIQHISVSSAPASDLLWLMVDLRPPGSVGREACDLSLDAEGRERDRREASPSA